MSVESVLHCAILKQHRQLSYEELSFTLMINHHAKQMLNQMWECENIQEKLGHEAKLIELMTAVHSGFTIGNK